jgi:hypothetical protein
MAQQKLAEIESATPSPEPVMIRQSDHVNRVIAMTITNIWFTYKTLRNSICLSGI